MAERRNHPSATMCDTSHNGAMEIGFTGTQNGITVAQDHGLRDVLVSLQRQADYDSVLHHGDCIGADRIAHKYAYRLGMRIEIWPQNAKEETRGWANNVWQSLSTIFHEPAAPLERNRSIVDATQVLVATPRTMREVLRSGTWATIRYARSKGRRTIIIYPDGTVVDSDA